MREEADHYETGKRRTRESNFRVAGYIRLISGSPGTGNLSGHLHLEGSGSFESLQVNRPSGLVRPTVIFELSIITHLTTESYTFLTQSSV